MTNTKELAPRNRADTPTKTLDPIELRKALGTFTTGVTIITACGEDGTSAGVTANSFSSVSLDPPLVLWSLARKSQSLATFESATHWAVHILAHDQDHLSSHFARSISGQEKFASVNHESGLGSAPLLSGCTARLQCRTANIYDGGDHIILVGEVLTYEKCDTPPLVFQKGGYAIAASTNLPATTSADEDPRNFSEQSSIGYLLASAYLHFSARLKEQAGKLKLNDIEFLILSALGAREGRTYHELISLVGYTGPKVGPEAINDLAVRGYLRIHDTSDSSPEDDHASISLTEEGRTVVTQIFVESSRVESEIICLMGVSETIALRTLLSRFVRTHSPLIPYRWF